MAFTRGPGLGRMGPDPVPVLVFLPTQRATRGGDKSKAAQRGDVGEAQRLALESTFLFLEPQHAWSSTGRHWSRFTRGKEGSARRTVPSKDAQPLGLGWTHSPECKSPARQSPFSATWDDPRADSPFLCLRRGSSPSGSHHREERG